MTYTVKSEKLNNYHIEINQNKYESVYHCILSQTYDGDLYRSLSDLVYPTYKKALSRYNYLKRKIKNNEV